MLESCRRSIIAYIAAFSVLFFLPLASAASHIIYVPIIVGDITIIIPVFNEDVNSNGIPDYDDPDLAAAILLPAFCAALTVGDIDLAAKFISPVQRSRYHRALSDLGVEGAIICSELTHVTLIRSDSHVREWTARRVVNGELRAYILTQTIGSDGVFRFSEF